MPVTARGPQEHGGVRALRLREEAEPGCLPDHRRVRVPVAVFGSKHRDATLDARGGLARRIGRPRLVLREGRVPRGSVFGSSLRVGILPDELFRRFRERQDPHRRAHELGHALLVRFYLVARVDGPAVAPVARLRSLDPFAGGLPAPDSLSRLVLILLILLGDERRGVGKLDGLARFRGSDDVEDVYLTPDARFGGRFERGREVGEPRPERRERRKGHRIDRLLFGFDADRRQPSSRTGRVLRGPALVFAVSVFALRVIRRVRVGIRALPR